MVSTSRIEESPAAPAPAIPLLETKLYVPRWRAGLVPRPELIGRIHGGAERRLTLVSAPAGSGKTTLLAEWIAGTGPAGWVSLDPSENDPTLFLAYVVRALQKVDPAVGKQALPLLHTSPPQAVLTALINEIADSGSDFVLVLDDYHVIEAQAVHDAVVFLLDHLPPRLHVVIATRSDPPLPLPRLRARGELIELRPADLRFTPDESSAFLNQVMALELSAVDLSKLERRTEGWIAGLKLAALSMQGRRDIGGFVDEFSGDHRYVADYLVEEVLQAQPENVRRFLLATAILDQLSGPLCDAVTGEPNSQALLEKLEKGNLFVVALDDERVWYRYHHLFADVLQAHALKEHPDLVRAFHRRASAWYEQRGTRTDAIRHALAAEDTERAADLLGAGWPARDRSYESARWLTRVKALPEAVVQARPVLGAGFAWALLNGGELEAADAQLRRVELSLEAGARGAVGVDEARLRSLPAEIASARVYLAQSRGDVAGTVEAAKRSLALTPDGDHEAGVVGTALLALAHWANGDLEDAHRTFTAALDRMRRLGLTLDVIRGIFVLGDLRVAQGRLHEAAGIYRRGLQQAAEQLEPGAAPETDELHLGLSELHREWGDLEAALEPLRTITGFAERAEHAGKRERWCTAMAAIRAAQGDPDGALELLREAESVQRRDPVPRVRPIPAIRARIWIAQGKLADAMAWARERGLTAEDELDYLREFEHVTLARLMIARHGTEGGERSLHEAVRLLERLTRAAEAGGRTGSVIEMLVLDALAQQMLGNVRGALTSLERALELAHPEGYLRVFLDEGGRMRDLLLQATARGVAGDPIRRVLNAFGDSSLAGAPGGTSGASELLTPRELVILRLLASGLRNQEIAGQLFISPATVKRHVANIYAKLGVGHRTEALLQAKELNLL
jgi:LuxR family maltose regulon positive regulatory protein